MDLCSLDTPLLSTTSFCLKVKKKLIIFTALWNYSKPSLAFRQPWQLIIHLHTGGSFTYIITKNQLSFVHIWVCHTACVTDKLPPTNLSFCPQLYPERRYAGEPLKRSDISTSIVCYINYCGKSKTGNSTVNAQLLFFSKRATFIQNPEFLEPNCIWCFMSLHSSIEVDRTPYKNTLKVFPASLHLQRPQKKWYFSWVVSLFFELNVMRERDWHIIFLSGFMGHNKH